LRLLPLVAEVEFVLLVGDDPKRVARVILKSDESFTSAGRFVVEEDAFAAKDVVGFAVADGMCKATGRDWFRIGELLGLVRTFRRSQLCSSELGVW
jgi:hypothetical protein